MTKYINLYGGPGSGKSTVAAGLFYQMKLKHLNVELITEYAKDLIYSETLNVLKKNQKYIFAEQNRRQHILEGKVDWAITDSPLLLSLFYGTNPDDFSQEAFLSLVSDTFQCYDNVSFFLDRPPHFSEEGRDRNLEQSIEIDNALLKILKDEYVKFVRLPTDEYTIEKIMSLIL